MRFAAASGSRMRPDVVTAFMDQFGDVIYNNYNATEAGLIASATPEDLRAAPDTAGKPAPGTEIRVLDKEFREVQTGEVGQIYCRSGTLFDGYTSGKTKDFYEGFMASGDMGFLDENGRLFVVGRDDEMIVSGGENVYPIEVEKTLASHPDVAEAVVIGVDDEQYGQRLAAFVVLNDGAGASPETLKQHVRESLANYKVPRQITVLDELPRSITGKIVRRDLQALVDNAVAAAIPCCAPRWNSSTPPTVCAHLAGTDIRPWRGSRSAGRPPRWLRCTWPARCWARSSARCAGTTRAGVAESPCCSR